MRPVVLPPNGIERFYRGGPAIAALRGTRPPGPRVPEDWVGSTTTVFGEEELGLSWLPSGELLRDAITTDPAGFLGADRTTQRGPDPALLVKLLDAGERLPVHVHPDGGFAHATLGVPYGKTEAWIVVDATAPDTTVHVGFREDVSPETLEGWVEAQDGPSFCSMRSTPARYGRGGHAVRAGRRAPCHRRGAADRRAAGARLLQLDDRPPLADGMGPRPSQHEQRVPGLPGQGLSASRGGGGAALCRRASNRLGRHVLAKADVHGRVRCSRVNDYQASVLPARHAEHKSTWVDVDRQPLRPRPGA